MATWVEACILVLCTIWALRPERRRWAATASARSARSALAPRASSWQTLTTMTGASKMPRT